MAAPVSLKALAESKAAGIQKATYFKVDPRIIRVEPGFNARDEGPELDEHLERMYLSMKSGAAFPPVDVRVEDGELFLVDGHCRTRTALRLIDEGIDIQLEARQFRGNEAERVAHMLTSAQGKSLTPLEAGRAYFRLVRFGSDITAIAARTGVTRTTIENGLLLAEAPVEVQQMIARGEVSSHTAIEVLRSHGKQAAVFLRGCLDTAKATGKTKVTKRHTSGPRVPPKVVKEFVAVTAVIRQSLGPQNFDLIMGMSDDELRNRSVEIPGAALKSLLAAHAQIV